MAEVLNEGQRGYALSYWSQGKLVRDFSSEIKGKTLWRPW
jgi:hypothetical protein